jgi:hypothetical protein
MLTCPMCKKSLRTMARECPSCRTDLSLLVDFHENQDDSLKRAEERTRSGDLGEAIWAYLEVLEVDPDNPTARKQVGRVVRAIRQFDQIAYKRWRQRQRKQARSRPWIEEIPINLSWLRIGMLVLLLAAILFVGFRWGYEVGQEKPAESTHTTNGQ